MSASQAQAVHDALVHFKESLPQGRHDGLLKAVDACLVCLASDFELLDRNNKRGLKSVATLERSLKYQKNVAAKAQARYEQELPNKIGGHVAHMWLVRAAFAPPNTPTRTLAEWVRNFPSDWTKVPKEVIANTTIAKSRDAFAELIKRFNREGVVELAKNLAPNEEGERARSIFVPLCHDEVSLRARSKVAPLSDAVETGGVVARSRTSKVLNQFLNVNTHTTSLEFFVELAALLRKDGPTLAQGLCNTLTELFNALLRGWQQNPAHAASGEKLRVYSLMTGDAINTNENAMKRVYKK